MSLFDNYQTDEDSRSQISWQAFDADLITDCEEVNNHLKKKKKKEEKEETFPTPNVSNIEAWAWW